MLIFGTPSTKRQGSNKSGLLVMWHILSLLKSGIMGGGKESGGSVVHRRLVSFCVRVAPERFLFRVCDVMVLFWRLKPLP